MTLRTVSALAGAPGSAAAGSPGFTAAGARIRRKSRSAAPVSVARRWRSAAPAADSKPIGEPGKHLERRDTDLPRRLKANANRIRA
jgi:hypothetical protein